MFNMLHTHFMPITEISEHAEGKTPEDASPASCKVLPATPAYQRPLQGRQKSPFSSDQHSQEGAAQLAFLKRGARCGSTHR